MKLTSHSPRRGQAGNVLVLTVVVTGLVGFTLASYLTLVKAQNQTTMRSQAWNNTMPVIEAGIEEALAHLMVHGTNRLDVDGWTKEGTLYWKQGYLPNAYYIITITNWFDPDSTSPIIESRGYVKKPVQVVSRTDALFADANSASAITAGHLARGVRVDTRRAPVFNMGMVADAAIDLNGNNIDADSFDSSDPNHSTNGQYDPLKSKDNGDLASNSGLTNSVNVGNANIKGRISVGPGGSVAIGPTGIVGDENWHQTQTSGIQAGAVVDDMNVDFSPIDPPFTGGAWIPGSGIVGGTSYRYVLGSGKYMMGSLNMSSSDTMLITGDAILYVTGNIDISGNASIVIATNATLQIYAGGATVSIMGNSVANLSGLAQNFAYYGLESNTKLTFGGNGEFIGTIYAPNADFDLNGSGRSGGIDFVGASITKSSKMNGHFKFHYDEDLKNHLFRGYVVTHWEEMGPQEIAALQINGVTNTGNSDGTTTQ